MDTVWSASEGKGSQCRRTCDLRSRPDHCGRWSSSGRRAGCASRLWHSAPSSVGATTSLWSFWVCLRRTMESFYNMHQLSSLATAQSGVPAVSLSCLVVHKESFTRKVPRDVRRVNSPTVKMFQSPLGNHMRASPNREKIQNPSEVIDWISLPKEGPISHMFSNSDLVSATAAHALKLSSNWESMRITESKVLLQCLWLRHTPL